MSWRGCVLEPGVAALEPSPLLGVIPGEGVGAEVTAAALEVLAALERAGGRAVTVERGGAIGALAEREWGAALPDAALGFCGGVLRRGGAILSGPGGGRYVYDLRRALDLFAKVSPIEERNALASASPLRPERLAGVDLLVVRENLAGVYQGRAEILARAGQGREVRHDVLHTQAGVRRFLDAAARLAATRRGELTVVVKDAGMAAFSALWRECAQEAAAAAGVLCTTVDVDLVAYQLIDRPARFDVIAASNLFGDVLSDVAAVLLGARGLSFGASFGARGEGVYQTNHGAAHDLAGEDRANPVGQILSLAMLLRESLEMAREAAACEAGIRRVWEQGYRTADVAQAGGAVVGTAELAARIAAAAGEELSLALARA